MKTYFRLSEKFFPVFILSLCIISYGLTLSLGYFWDDWFVMWNFHAMGSRGVFESYVMDRPVHGYLLGYLMQILGETPVIWHFTALLVRYLGVVVSWLILRRLWPKQTLENAITATLIAIYPGFTQQSMTVIYILQVFGAMTLWGTSIWLMLYAYQQKHFRAALILLSCIFLFAHLALSEYFIGLEFIRPVFLGLAFTQITTLNFRASWRLWAKEIFFHWLPYLAALIAYLVYRLVFFQSGRPATDSSSIIQQILTNPLAEFSHRVASLLTDPVDVTILAWLQPLSKFIAEYYISPRYWWGYMGIFAGTTLLVWVFFASLKDITSDNQDSPHRVWATQAFGLGCAAVIFAGLPLWGINREVFLGGLGDRYSFPFIFGSALLLTSWLSWSIERQNTKAMFAALLIGMAVGFHLWNTYRVFQTDWGNQKNFHSQLIMRLPEIKQGTSIWVVKDPAVLAMEGDYGLAMPVNWIYEPDNHSAQVNYWVFPLTDEFLSRSRLFRTAPGPSLQRPLRNITFSGNPDQTIAVWFAPPACLRIIDPNQPELMEVLAIPANARSLVQVNSIKNGSKVAQFPVTIFGEPEKDWCYYFEQADMARQTGNWQKVTALGNEAKEKGVKPAHDSEWLPFIEADFQLEHYDDAARMIDLIKNGQISTPKILICGFAERMIKNYRVTTNPAQGEFLKKVYQQNECSDYLK
jgi:hypothetical protein